MLTYKKKTFLLVSFFFVILSLSFLKEHSLVAGKCGNELHVPHKANVLHCILQYLCICFTYVLHS